MNFTVTYENTISPFMSDVEYALIHGLGVSKTDCWALMEAFPHRLIGALASVDAVADIAIEHFGLRQFRRYYVRSRDLVRSGYVVRLDKEVVFIALDLSRVDDAWFA